MIGKYKSKQYLIKPEIPFDQDVCYLCGRQEKVTKMRLDADADADFICRSCDKTLIKKFN